MSVSAPASWSKSYSPYRTLPSTRRPARHIISLRDLSGRLANFSSDTSSLQQKQQQQRSGRQDKHRRHQSLSVPHASRSSSSSVSHSAAAPVSMTTAGDAVSIASGSTTGGRSDGLALSSVSPFRGGATGTGASVVRRDSVPLSSARSHRRHLSSQGETRRGKTDNVSTDGVDGWCCARALRGARAAGTATAPRITLAPLGSTGASLAGSGGGGAPSSGVSRFPKLTECAHFHYDNVQLGPLLVQLYTDDENESEYAATNSNNSLLLYQTAAQDSSDALGSKSDAEAAVSFHPHHQNRHLEPPLLSPPMLDGSKSASASAITSIPPSLSPSLSSLACPSLDPPVFTLQVTSNGHSWLLRRSYDNLQLLDKQLHSCIYDRKFSQLVPLPSLLEAGRLAEEAGCSVRETLCGQIAVYVRRFSCIAGSAVNCAPVLSWLQLDNRGNRLLVADDGAGDINQPAVAAALVVRRCVAHAADEISLEVGDMISVIDMSPSTESLWWRGKRGFQVGFFPCECVKLIGDKVPSPSDLLYPLQLAASSATAECSNRPLLRKRGKLLAFFRNFMQNRPSRRRLKERGILKERVFGCDLGEHLINLGHSVPFVLQHCAQFIESSGIVDGVYRLSGITSNIQRLRNTFDEGRVPDLTEPCVIQDIHSVSCVLKQYFRELPNPLLTFQLYDSFVAAVQCGSEQRLLRMREVVQQLPPPHYRTLESLIGHLSTVSQHGAVTGMTAKNLAIVWAPNLVRSVELEAASGVAALQGVGVQAVVVEYLIRYRELIFSDKLPSFSPAQSRDNDDSRCSPRRRHQHHHRPKSLAILTPTKLLTLEEARCRALLVSMGASGGVVNDGDVISGVSAAAVASMSEQKYIDVGGGPESLPARYHTVIELPRRRKSGSMKLKRSPMAWRSLFRAKTAKASAKEPTNADRTPLLSRQQQQLAPSPASSQPLAAGSCLCDSRSSCLDRRSLRSVHSADVVPCSGSRQDSRHSLLNLVSVLRLSPLLSPSPAQSSSSPVAPCTTIPTTVPAESSAVPAYTSFVGGCQPQSALVSVPSSSVLTHSRSVSLDSFFDRRFFDTRLPYCDDDDEDVNNDDEEEIGEEEQEESGKCDRCVDLVRGNSALSISGPGADGTTDGLISDCRDLHVLSDADTLHQQKQQQHQPPPDNQLIARYSHQLHHQQLTVSLAEAVARCASAETLSRSTTAPPSGGGGSESTTGDDASELRADCSEALPVLPRLPLDGVCVPASGEVYSERELDCCTEQDVERELATDSDSVSISVSGGVGGLACSLGVDSTNESPIKQQQQQQLDCEQLVSLSEELGQLQRKLYTDSPPLSYIVLQAAEAAVAAISDAYVINSDADDDDGGENREVIDNDVALHSDKTSGISNGGYHVVSPIPQAVSAMELNCSQSAFSTGNDSQQQRESITSFGCGKCIDHQSSDTAILCQCRDHVSDRFAAGYTRLQECFSSITPDSVGEVYHTAASPSSPSLSSSLSSSKWSLHDPERSHVMGGSESYLPDIDTSTGASDSCAFNAVSATDTVGSAVDCSVTECSRSSPLPTVAVCEQANDYFPIESVTRNAGDVSFTPCNTEPIGGRIPGGVSRSAVLIASRSAEPSQLISESPSVGVEPVCDRLKKPSGRSKDEFNVVVANSHKMNTTRGESSPNSMVENVIANDQTSQKTPRVVSPGTPLDTSFVGYPSVDNASSALERSEQHDCSNEQTELDLEPSCSCLRSHHDVVLGSVVGVVPTGPSQPSSDNDTADVFGQASLVSKTSSSTALAPISGTIPFSSTIACQDSDREACTGKLSKLVPLSSSDLSPSDLSNDNKIDILSSEDSRSDGRLVGLDRDELCCDSFDTHKISQLSRPFDELSRFPTDENGKHSSVHKENEHLPVGRKCIYLQSKEHKHTLAEEHKPMSADREREHMLVEDDYVRSPVGIISATFDNENVANDRRASPRVERADEDNLLSPIKERVCDDKTESSTKEIAFDDRPLSPKTSRASVEYQRHCKLSSTSSVKQLLSKFELGETLPATAVTVAASGVTAERVRMSKRRVSAPLALPIEGGSRQSCLLTARPFKRQLSMDSAASDQQSRAMCRESRRDPLLDVACSGSTSGIGDFGSVADRLVSDHGSISERKQQGDSLSSDGVPSSLETDPDVVVRHSTGSITSSKTTQSTVRRPTSLPLFGSTLCVPATTSTETAGHQPPCTSRPTPPVRSRVPPGLPVSPHRSRASVTPCRIYNNNNSTGSGNDSGRLADLASPSESVSSGGDSVSGRVWRRSRSPLTPLAERSSSSPSPSFAVSPHCLSHVSSSSSATTCRVSQGVTTTVSSAVAAITVASLVPVPGGQEGVSTSRPSLAPAPQLDRSARERIDRYKAERRSFLQKKMAAEGLMPPTADTNTDNTCGSTTMVSSNVECSDVAVVAPVVSSTVERHFVRARTLSGSGRHHVVPMFSDVSSSSTIPSPSSVFLQSTSVERRVSVAAPFGVELRPCVRRHSTSALRSTSTGLASGSGCDPPAAPTAVASEAAEVVSSSRPDHSTGSAMATRSKYCQQRAKGSLISDDRKSPDSNRKWSMSDRKYSEAVKKSATPFLKFNQTEQKLPVDDRKWSVSDRKSPVLDRKLPISGRKWCDRQQSGGSVDERLAEARRRVAAFTAVAPSTGFSENHDQ